jgi:RNA polymerase sigma-70 factor (ECF subfamily)
VPPIDAEQSRWFAEEVQPHEPALRAYLRGSFPTLQDVDDLIQDAYTRLLRARSAGTVQHPKAYLFATARNAAVDLFRRRQVASFEPLVENHESSVLSDEPHPADAIARNQQLETLRAAIAALPPRCREIVVMRKIRGMSYAEIAAQLGLAESTVNAQLAIGVARCRRYLAEHGLLKESADGR